MAGIGFKLRRYTEEGSYFSLLKGYAYSAIIVAGPWLLTILTLGGVAFMGERDLAGRQLTMTLFHVTIMYIFSFSLIALGIFQFVVTRFLADKLYRGEIEDHAPTFLACLLLFLVPQALAVALFILPSLQAPPLFLLIAFAAYILVNAIWILLLFLGVLRAYLLMVQGFLLGSTVSFVAGAVLGKLYGETGALGGFLLGQILTFSLLLRVFLSEFPWKRPLDFSFLSYFRRYPALAILGLFYYLSVWIDKFLIRASPAGIIVVPPYFSAAPDYEVAFFMAQLTIVPALALFFLRVETDFYDRYREFFAGISQHRPYSLLKRKREEIVKTMKEGFWTLLKTQGLVTLASILLAPQLFHIFWFSEGQVQMLRVALIGTFFQTLLFLVIIMKLYFELYREALASSLLFFLLNALLTLLFMEGGSTTGWGFALSAGVSFLLATTLLLSSVNRLEMTTFLKQPLKPHLPREATFINRGGIGRYHLESGQWRTKDAGNP